VRRQRPRHHIERSKTIDLVFVLPHADGGAMARPPQCGPSRRHQRKAGFVLAQPHALPRWGFFLTPPMLPAPPAAAPGRLADTGTSADRAVCHGADRSPASRCV
jgi:hypothetical protein